MIKIIQLQINRLLIVLFAVQAIAFQPLCGYDLFSGTAGRMATACQAVGEQVGITGTPAMQEAFKQVHGKLQHGTTQEIAQAFESIAQACVTQNNTKVPIATDPLAMLMMRLLLERLVTIYYTQLDTLETAYMYWDWAAHNEMYYSLSKSPTKWMSEESQKNEITHKKAHAEQLRAQFNKHLGAVVRLLAIEKDPYCSEQEWATAALVIINSACADEIAMSGADSSDTCSVTQCARCAGRLSAYEKELTELVSFVAQPSWFVRNWLPLTVGAAAVAAGAYYYGQNQEWVQTRLSSLPISIKNFWQQYFCDPAKNFKHEVQQAFSTSSSVPEGTVQMLDQEGRYAIFVQRMPDGTLQFLDQPVTCKLTNAQAVLLAQEARAAGMSQFGAGDSALSDWMPGKGFLVEVKNGTYKFVSGVEVNIQQLQNSVQEMLRVVLKGYNANRLNIILGSCGPAVGITWAVLYCGSSLLHWLGKKDRRLLRYRLCQVEDLLIRSDHELVPDTEYGRLLYLLMKEHEQVAKNVLSDERPAFMDDLRYLAAADPSVMQKKETIKTMWRKYRSLASPA